MSALADQLARQIKSGNGSFREGLLELRRQLGSVTAASRAAGIDRRTYQRHMTGKIRAPKSSTTERVRAAVLGQRIAAQGVGVKWTFDGRERNLKFGGTSHQKLKPGAEKAMADAAVRGDKEGVAQAFIDGIDDDGYHGLLEATYEGETDATDYGGTFG